MNGWRISWALAIVVLTLRVKSFGQGGPPLIGDDPGTPGNKHWEINVSYQYFQSPGISSMDVPLLDLNYGLGDHIELSYEGGWLFGQNNGTWQNGYDDSQLGVKWRFLDQDKNGVDMSVYPQWNFNTTKSLTTAGFVESGNGLYVPFEIAKTIGKLELDGEAGFQWWEYDRDQWAGGPIIGYLLNERIELLGEARFTFDQNFRTYDLILDGGGRFTINDHMQILFAAGRSVRSGDSSVRLYLFSGLGFTF
jgi:hypothetical protein